MIVTRGQFSRLGAVVYAGQQEQYDEEPMEVDAGFLAAPSESLPFCSALEEPSLLHNKGRIWMVKSMTCHTLCVEVVVVDGGGYVV
jgi:hypothetical protein